MSRSRGEAVGAGFDGICRTEGVFIDGRYVMESGSDLSAPTGMISVSRLPFQYRDRMRSYRIVIDGHFAGQVKAGQTLIIEVPSGSHSARARIDWTGSPTIKLNVAPGTTVELWAEPAGSAATALFQAMSSDGYIALTQSPS